jgi:hypothetical protein
MIWWALGSGAIGTLAAVCWALVERTKRAFADGRFNVVQVELVAAKAQASDSYRQFRDLQARTDEERGRLEALVVRLKRDAALAWESYNACAGGESVPGDVAIHLQRLLSTPIDGGVTTASVVVQTGPAP